MNITANFLIDVVRLSDSKNRGLTNKDFFGETPEEKYFSVVYVVEEDTSVVIDRKRFDMFLIKDEKTCLHFTDSTSLNAYFLTSGSKFPKNSYFITKKEFTTILRDKKLDTLLNK